MPTFKVELIPMDGNAVVFRPYATEPPNQMDFGLWRPSFFVVNSMMYLQTGYKIRIPPGLQARVFVHPHLMGRFPLMQVGRPYVLPAGEHEVHVVAFNPQGIFREGEKVDRGYPVVRLIMEYAPQVEWHTQGIRYRLPGQPNPVRTPKECKMYRSEADKRFADRFAKRELITKSSSWRKNRKMVVDLVETDESQPELPVPGVHVLEEKSVDVRAVDQKVQG